MSGPLGSNFFPLLRALAPRIGAHAEDMLAVMTSESQIDPAAWNHKGNASGLIQFMPDSLRGLGWTAGDAAFRMLSGEQQLPYVEDFYKRNGRGAPLGSAGRLYWTTYFPRTLSRGSSPDAIVTSATATDPQERSAYLSNAGLDPSSKGWITLGDLDAWLAKKRLDPRYKWAVAQLGDESSPTPAPSSSSRAAGATTSSGGAVAAVAVGLAWIAWRLLR